MAEEMKETMKDYEREINASFKTIREGDVLKGSVIGISDTEVILDLGYYTEGVIRAEDYSADPSFQIGQDVKVGDEIKSTVILVDDGNGRILMSKKEADKVLAWEKLQTLMEERIRLTVKIQDVVNAGVIAYVEGIRGFIPASQLSLEYEENLDEWLQKTIDVQIITVDENNQKLVMSAKEILKEEVEKDRKSKLSNLEVGLVVEGIVESIKPYGAFVKLENGLTGLVHVSQVCAKRIKTPFEVLKEGETVKVKVIRISDGKLSLSMKALQDVTTHEIEEEVFELEETEEIGTRLGDLFKNIKL